MNLGESPRRMHDPKAYLSSLFSHEWAKFQYAHEDLPDDSIYRVAINFKEALGKIVDPDVKANVFKYQKDLKESTLHFRKVNLSIEENLQRKNIEKEAKDQATSSSSTLVAQSKAKGKAVMETHVRTQPSKMLEICIKGQNSREILKTSVLNWRHRQKRLHPGLRNKELNSFFNRCKYHKH